MWNVGFGTSRMSWRCVRSIIRSSPASGAHIFVAALALLVQRLLDRRLRDAGIEFSSTRAMEALSTVRHVTFRVEGEGRRGGGTGGSPGGRRGLKGLKIGELRPPAAPAEVAAPG